MTIEGFKRARELDSLINKAKEDKYCFLKVATKEELAKVYGYSSLDSLFDSESVETIVNDFKTAVDNRKRVYELVDSIGIYALRTIVNELYDYRCYKTSMLKQAIKESKSEQE